MLLTIPSQPSSRKLDQGSTFPGKALIRVRNIVTRQIIQTDHFRAIMVDLEPTVVDEVISTRTKSVANISVFVFFSLPRLELALIANSSIRAS